MEEVCEGKDFNFPKEEEKILEFWGKIDAFKTQLKRTEGKPEYIFYDGPPFATGLPHYGHILAGTIKDIVTRYKSTSGYHVTRRFGWDCHGLPVEYEIDQKLNIKTREDVLKFGIDNYNEECRSIVMRYSSEWEKIVTRVGRWIDFENDYKTLDLNFMESVWWVFKQLYDKGLVYRGFKVMPYSIGCNTPLSNFEAGLNYKDVSDPAVMVSFPLIDDSDAAAIVAWTTTPWTLPSNLALCVNDNFTYLKLRNKETGSVLIVAETRASSLPSKKKSKTENSGSDEKKIAEEKKVSEEKKDKKDKKEKKGNLNKNTHSDSSSSQIKLDSDTYEVLSSMKGSELVGKKYKPIFDYFNEFLTVGFKVISDNYVTDDSGTGVVHCAPAFGEDDYRVCINARIIDKGEEIPTSVDFNGRFTEKVVDFKGKYVKDADKEIIATIKAMGRLVSSGNIVHSYPFCWRSDTPLIYKSVPSWFVAVEKIKDRLVHNNEQTYWVPEYVKEKRFHNWLENARDWAISRSRFWGTPLPIWISEDGKEIQVVGSVQQLKELTGHEATDLHRHKIDHITIPSKRGNNFPPLKRVEDVFDCWFESGSMPYGYIHYPFENTELFEKNFPGDFVAEGLDQTRGWFYTLMVLSTALFDKPAFKNLICNGLVLAEDGKKMSKRLKNYPPPTEIVDSYGADALRLYLINSPVVRAEPLRFKKEGVFAVVKDVFLPWYNAFRFFMQNALRLKIENNEDFIPININKLKEIQTLNTLDKWIISSTSSLSDFVYQEMESYRLYTVVPYLLKFIDNLTNIYVRFNRKRLKGKTGDDDCKIALSTLYYVLVTVCKAMSSFTPFFCENLFQKLRKISNIEEESIHYCSFPKAEVKSDKRIEESVSRMMRVIELARNIREKNNKPLKKPLKEMIIVHPDEYFLEDITGKLKEYVLEELNIRNIIPCSDKLKFSTLRAEPDFSVLGKKLGKSMGIIAKEVKCLDISEILEFENKGEINIKGHVLKSGEIKICRDFKPPEGMKIEDMGASGDGDVLVILDLRTDESLLDAGIAREMVNRIQKLRKKCGLEPTDSIEIFFENCKNFENNSNILRVINTQMEYFKVALGSPLLPKSIMPEHSVEISKELFSGVSGENFVAILTKPSLYFIREKIVQLCKGDVAFASSVEVALLARDPLNLRAELAKNENKVRVVIEGHDEYEVKLGEHFHLSVGEYYSLNYVANGN